MRLRNKLLLTVLVTVVINLAFVAPQTLTVTIPPDTPFLIEWDQQLEGAFTMRYRWWCNDVIVKNFAPADLTISPTFNEDRTQAIRATVPGLPAGTHACFISAVDPAGGFPEKKGDAIALAVGTGPTTPLRLRVVVTVKGGEG